jgi:hypothetical protein
LSKANWTDERLTGLFRYYNRKYWGDRLPKYSVSAADLSAKDCLGQCDWRLRTIEIDTAKHKNDRAIRATVLHEMAHAATTRQKAHGLKFWEELERLLRKGAPLKIGFPEAPGLRILNSAVPRHLKLCRKAAEAADAQEQRKIQRRLAAMPKFDEYGFPTTIEATDDYIANNFEDAAVEGASSRAALAEIGRDYGLLNIEGRPKNKRAAGLIEKCQKVYRRARRDYLASKRSGERMLEANRVGKVQ